MKTTIRVDISYGADLSLDDRESQLRKDKQRVFSSIFLHEIFSLSIGEDFQLRKYFVSTMKCSLI